MDTFTIFTYLLTGIAAIIAGRALRRYIDRRTMQKLLPELESFLNMPVPRHNNKQIKWDWIYNQLKKAESGETRNKLLKKVENQISREEKARSFRRRK